MLDVCGVAPRLHGSARHHRAGAQPLADEAGAARRGLRAGVGLRAVRHRGATAWSGPGSAAPRSSPARVAAGRRVARASCCWFLVRPLRRQVTDEQVALYLEEHEPSLQATLLSAVEASRAGATASRRRSCSASSSRRSKRCAAGRRGAPRRADAAAPLSAALALAGVAVARCWSVLVGPAFIRQALSALLLRPASVEAAAPYRHRGDARQRHGARRAPIRRSPPSCSASTPKTPSLMARRTPTAAFEPMPLVRNEDGTYEGDALRRRRRRSSTSSRPTACARRPTR